MQKTLSLKKNKCQQTNGESPPGFIAIIRDRGGGNAQRSRGALEAGKWLQSPRRCCTLSRSHTHNKACSVPTRQIITTARGSVPRGGRISVAAKAAPAHAALCSALGFTDRQRCNESNAAQTGTLLLLQVEPFLESPARIGMRGI